jgi:hypothetical protein
MAEYDPSEREKAERQQAYEQERRAQAEELMSRARERDEGKWDGRQARWQAKWERRQARWDARRARWGAYGPHGPVRGPHVIGGVFAGIILTSIGVLFLLQNLGIHGFEDAWDYWPIILIALGVSRAASSYGWGGRLWGGTLVAVGTIFLLENLGWLPRVTWGRLWPLVIVALGISMLVKNLERQHRRDQAANVPSVGAGSGADPKAGAGPTIAGSSSGATSSSLLSEWAVFGGAEIDLRGAGMTKEEVIIDVNAVFGGVEIYAPDTWEVVMRGAPIFGGYDDGTTLPRRVEGKKTPRLIIAGSAVFGGVSVKN